VGSGVFSVRLWAPAGCAGAALGGAVRALWARLLGVPGKALRPRWPAGYQARLRRPRNAVLSKITHPLNIIDFTSAKVRRSARRFSSTEVILAASPTETVRLQSSSDPILAPALRSCCALRASSASARVLGVNNTPTATLSRRADLNDSISARSFATKLPA